MSTPASGLVDATGRPLRRPQAASDACPGCGAGKDRRVPSAGFGTPHEVCEKCGHEFKETE